MRLGTGPTGTLRTRNRPKPDLEPKGRIDLLTYP